SGAPSRARGCSPSRRSTAATPTSPPAPRPSPSRSTSRPQFGRSRRPGGPPEPRPPGDCYLGLRLFLPSRSFPMSILGSLSTWFPDSGRRKQAPVRRPVRARLALEALEDRSLMSANFHQVNLVSDLPGAARLLDPTLKNPWGISLSPNGGAFWVSSN